MCICLCFCKCVCVGGGGEGGQCNFYEKKSKIILELFTVSLLVYSSELCNNDKTQMSVDTTLLPVIFYTNNKDQMRRSLF